MRQTFKVLVAVLAVLAGEVAEASTPKQKDGRPSIALVAVTRGAGFSQEQVSTIEEVLLSAIERTNRFRVVGRTDIDALLTLDAKKQAAGCEETGCLAEIAGALGVDYVASASAGRLGDVTVLALKVIDVRTAAVIVHARQTVRSDSALVASADALATEAASKVPLSLSERAMHPVAPARHRLAWGTVILGAASLLAGALVGLTVRLDTNTLHTVSSTRTLSTEQSLQRSINTRVLAADVLFGAGGAVSATGLGLVLVFR